MKKYRYIPACRMGRLGLLVLCPLFVVLSTVEAQVAIQVDANYTPCSDVGIGSLAGRKGSGCLSIVPNPNTGIFSVRFAPCSAGDRGTCSIEIVDPIGRMIFRQQTFLDEKIQSVIPIELTGMSKGVYFIKVIPPSGAGYPPAGRAGSQKLILE